MHLVGDLATTEPYGVAMNLEDEDLVRRVNKVLEDFRAGGRKSAWRSSYESWLREILLPPSLKGPDPPEPVYRNE